MEEEQLHVLTQNTDGHWIVFEDLPLTQPKNKDMVVFEMTKPMDRYVQYVCTSTCMYEYMSRRSHISLDMMYQCELSYDW